MSESGRAVADVDHAPGLERAFAAPPAESDYRVESVRGRVPAYLRGSYYVNGPARFACGEVRYGHWLDGDGMVCALHFDAETSAGAGPRFVNRFVRGTKLRDEEAAGEALYRAFGTAFAGDRLKRGVGLESPVNVSAYRRGDALLAFGEQGLPWALDPLTLETRGEHDFSGRLNAISPLSAHPHFDPRNGEMLNFGISFSARHPSLTLYRFAADDSLLYRRRLALPYPCSVHDFGLSDAFAVFYLSPYLLDIARLLDDGVSLLDALSWQPERGSRLLVVARASGNPVASVALPVPGYCLHLIDCFEQGGELVVDVIELDEPVYDQYRVPELFPEARGSRPRRYRVDVGGERLVGEETLDYREMCDFPALDPRRRARGYDRFWVLGIGASARPGRKFFDKVVCCDWSTGGVAGQWQAPAGSYLGGEPVFAPDPSDARAGAVICQRYDAEREASSFLIFDAHDLAAGPLAELPLRAPVPPLFHASWEPA